MRSKLTQYFLHLFIAIIIIIIIIIIMIIITIIIIIAIIIIIDLTIINIIIIILIIIFFFRGATSFPGLLSLSGGSGAVGKAQPPNEGEALGKRLRSEREGIVTVLARHY